MHNSTLYISKYLRFSYILILALNGNNNTEAAAQRSYAHAALNYKTESQPVRVIVNEKPLINKKRHIVFYLYRLLLIYG